MNLNELLIELSAKTVGYEGDLAYAFHLMPDDGLCCEFGVMEGRTFRPSRRPLPLASSMASIGFRDYPKHGLR